MYCIFRQDSNKPPEPGICHVVADNGLAAAVSKAEVAGSTPDISSLLAYEQVVEAMHAGRDVIPLRYGHRAESEAAIVLMLEEHRHAYEPLLARLRGMAEMGIRLLCPARPPSRQYPSSSPGTQYLASLRDRLPAGQPLDRIETRLADEIAGLLKGCYVEHRREGSPAADGGRLVSLYFLTPKTSVGLFRDKAREISLAGVRILRSGPWPPYNFVADN